MVPIVISGISCTNFLFQVGLQVGDRIVSGGYDHLHEGDLINPQPVKDEAANRIANN